MFIPVVFGVIVGNLAQITLGDGKRNKLTMFARYIVVSCPNNNDLRIPGTILISGDDIRF